MSRSAGTGVVAVLCSLLEDTDPVIAGAAAESLGNLGAREAVPALAACLSRDDLWLRPAAIDALARIGDAEAFAAIAELPLNAPGPVVSAAVHALARSSSVDPVAACRRLALFLNHPSRPVVEDALLAIALILDERVGKTDGFDLVHVFTDAAHAVPAAPAARLALTHRDPALRRAGAVVLSRTAAWPRDLDELASMLEEDPDPSVRGAAVLALAAHGRLGQPQLSDIVADATAPDVLRISALRAIAARLDAAGERALVGLITNGCGAVEQAAANVLAGSGHESSGRAAILWLHEAWDELDDPEALASVMAIESGSGPALATVVLDSCEGESRSALFSAVLRPADACSMADATHVVMRAIADSDQKVRTHALRLVAAGVPGPFEPAVRLALTDCDARVRVRAFGALVAFPNAADDDAVLLAARTDSSAWVRAAALAATSQRGCCDVETIAAAQLDDFAPVRHAALVAAVELASKELASASSDALLRIAILAQSEDDPSMVDLGRRLETRLS